MKKIVRLHYEKELSLYKQNYDFKSFEQCWEHLERAHILGQFSWKDHFFVHIKMFTLAVRSRNVGEIIGQIPRLILAIPGSLLGKAPKGNIGSSKVGIFQPMSIPEDLKQIIEFDENRKGP
ncbi:hypothetical protein C0V70_06115 [Bacteriovorax stolpii]|uniref:Uncharacterized protein n=1 Tax=Bacteriovorax stolpii TaxID=960 RepID=A0A2K9NQC2_BACTC|nr:DUF3703 domain-containing protein [Bacteriovorax stolpii]AUN97692.1 hypothetical protein C0V70_06115 [Bacteriovorax stolpii]TDP51511.1 uncharacterized protein DUF3703 [Bacteriovorax stolpii]